jgi:short-subunit dehydrogenase
VGVDLLDLYTDIEPAKIQDMISLNCYPVAFINRYFLPILKKRTAEKKLKCAIVNIASTAGILSLPYFQVYCASKAYVDRFSHCLSYENP